MKELLTQYAGFNEWANKRIIETIDPLPDDLRHQEIISSFSSMYRTLLHIWDAESSWWQRMSEVEIVTAPSSRLNLSSAEVMDVLLVQSAQWKTWVASRREEELYKSFDYKNLKGVHYSSKVFQMLQHLFNHGTYHRGQLVTMLRQLGVTAIPSTDFIAYTRE